MIIAGTVSEQLRDPVAGTVPTVHVPKIGTMATGIIRNAVCYRQPILHLLAKDLANKSLIVDVAVAG